MVATTFETPAETVAPRKSLLRRFIDAMIEARMMQAQRELQAFHHIGLHR